MADAEKLLAEYKTKRDRLQWWGRAVLMAFELPEVRDHVHSLRFRMKSEERVKAKITKPPKGGGVPIQKLSDIHDLAGVRVLHLRQQDIEPIHQFIIGNANWQIVDEAVAINWDDRFAPLLERLGIRRDPRPGEYTSIHYSVGSEGLVCEIQVRTLFEEIWGELDHPFYEHPERKVLAARHLTLLHRLCTIGAFVIEDLDHFTAEHGRHEQAISERDALVGTLQERVKELEGRLRALEGAGNSPEIATQISAATGVAAEVGRIVSNIRAVAFGLPASIVDADAYARSVGGYAGANAASVVPAEAYARSVAGYSTAKAAVANYSTAPFTGCSKCGAPIPLTVTGIGPALCKACLTP